MKIPEIRDLVARVFTQLTSPSLTGSPFVIGPFARLSYSRRGRIVLEYPVGPIAETAADRNVALDPNRLYAIIKTEQGYYAVYESENLNYYSTFASPVLPQGEVLTELELEYVKYYDCDGIKAHEMIDPDCVPVRDRVRIRLRGLPERVVTANPSFMLRKSRQVVDRVFEKWSDSVASQLGLKLRHEYIDAEWPRGIRVDVFNHEPKEFVGVFRVSLVLVEEQQRYYDDEGLSYYDYTPGLYLAFYYRYADWPVVYSRIRLYEVTDEELRHEAMQLIEEKRRAMEEEERRRREELARLEEERRRREEEEKRRREERLRRLVEDGEILDVVRRATPEWAIGIAVWVESACGEDCDAWEEAKPVKLWGNGNGGRGRRGRGNGERVFYTKKSWRNARLDSVEIDAVFKYAEKVLGRRCSAVVITKGGEVFCVEVERKRGEEYVKFYAR